MNIREELEIRLRKYPGKIFTLVVNNDVVNYSNNYVKPKLVKIRYKRDRYDNFLQIGHFVRTGSENRLEDMESVENRLNNELIETVIDGIDLSPYIRNVDNIKIDVNTDFNIISVITPAYKIVRDIAKNNEGTMTGGSIGGVTIGVDLMTRLYDWFQSYSINAYHNVLKFLLMRKLRDMRELRFYFLMDAFVPITVYGSSESFLFNPFMYIPKYRKEFEQSRMFQLGNHSKRDCNGITVMFLTAKEICECFNLHKFVKFNWEFFIEILGGWFCDDLPNPNKVFYILITADDELPKVITEKDYRENSWAKDNYARITTLENVCRRYSRILSVPDKQVMGFIELMGKRLLVSGTN